MRTFTEYALLQDCKTAREELADHLIESQVDLVAFNQALDILNEEGWDYNPARTGLEMGAAGAGAVVGSALGPLGTVAGGVLGGIGGRAASAAMGKFFKGTRVEPIEPVHRQAQQAVDKLFSLLSKSPVQNISDEDHQKRISNDPVASKYFGNLTKIKSFLDTTHDTASQVDQNRNKELDDSLRQGGGVSGVVKKIPGLGWLGGLLEKVPVLNQDMGLRRAVSRGMDAVQVWAAKNPKKAALINAAAGLAGAATGAYGASKLQQAFTSSPQSQPSNSAQDDDWEDVQPKQQAQQSQGNRPSSQVKGFASGKVDNSAAFGGDGASGNNPSQDANFQQTTQGGGSVSYSSQNVDGGRRIRKVIDRGWTRIPAVSPEAAALGKARSIPLLPD